jgi:hypothetical protein
MALFKEIGGNFTLDTQNTETVEKVVFQLESPYFFSSGRSAIRALICLAKVANKKVALPYFTCHSVIEPFFNEGCEIVFYTIGYDLMINEDVLIEFCRFEKPDLLFFHDYFGMNHELVWRKLYTLFRDDIIFVNDRTHSFFSTKDAKSSHYALMSIRKWGAISEGGFLQVNFNHTKLFDYEDRVHSDSRLLLFKEASKLKNAYLEGDFFIDKDSFRRLFYQSESCFDREEGIYPIFESAFIAWNNVQNSDMPARRCRNFNQLAEGWSRDWLKWGSPIDFLVGQSIPLYFPILLNIERDRFQSFLASKGVYAPIIWPKSPLINCAGDDTLYDNLLCIPIDQRYGDIEMTRILNVFAEFHLMVCSND